MSNLKTMTQELEKAKSVKEALQIGFVKDTFIRNYQAITGRVDGNNRFMAETFHYLEIINENDKLKNADKFSHFAAIVKAGTTGLSFGKEGQLYPILYGNVVKVQIGAHGKRELLRRMPTVKFLGEGQVILKGDQFKHDKINNVLLEHIASEKQPTATLDNIVASYVRIQFTDKTVDVVVYHDELVKAKSKSKNKNEGNVWESWPVPMSAKVAYNRAYKLYYSQPQIQVVDLKGFDVPDDEEEEDIKDISHIEETSTPEAEITKPVKVEEVKSTKSDKDLESFLKN